VRVLLLLALLSEAGYLILFRLGDLGVFLVEFWAVFFTTFLFYLVACWHSRQFPSLTSSKRAMWVILLGGLAFRLTLAPLLPTLTEDPYRYRWNARLQAAGGNPYRDRPSDPRWASLRDLTWPSVTGRDLTSPYGPLLEWSYRASHAVASSLTSDPTGQVVLFKIPYLLCELLLAGLLWTLLTRLRLPGSWLLVYFWSPLVIVEFWASGHHDPFLLCFLCAALLTANAGRWFWAFGALWAATLIKFWPALLFPLFLWTPGTVRPAARMVRAAAWLPGVALVCLPFWSSLDDLRWMLEGMLGGWTNNASLFHFIYAALDRDFERTRSVMGLLIGGAALLVAVRRPPLPEGMLWTIVVILLLSANCFPWYLTWLVPLLVLRPSAPLLLWTGLVPLAYHVLPGYRAFGEWREDPVFLWLEYLPVYTMLLVWPWLTRYGRFGVKPAVRSAGSPPTNAGASSNPSPGSLTTAPR
jgi:alpha-1,6-mannosyltransferase